MRQSVSPALPAFERTLLCIVKKLVPPHEREEWSRSWQAELWYMHQRSRHRDVSPLAGIFDLSMGLTRDALWLRTETWSIAFSDTAALCLASLLALSVLSAVIALALAGSWQSLDFYLRDQFTRSLIAAPPVLFVLLATAPRRHAGTRSITRWRFWIKRQFFFLLKTLQVLLLAFLLSIDLCVPLHGPFPFTADLLQLFAFVFFSLIGLRWSIEDQEQRCKQCLRSLTTPARVGRPSHNLLEWNGTERSCKQGHGLLSIPEMETSWCQSSRWIHLDLSL
ncbi:MAG: hypothetical protein ACJ72H_31995 [Candidatus Sulfotelmatobacter sp.]